MLLSLTFFLLVRVERFSAYVLVLNVRYKQKILRNPVNATGECRIFIYAIFAWNRRKTQNLARFRILPQDFLNTGSLDKLSGSVRLPAVKLAELEKKNVARSQKVVAIYDTYS